MKRTLNWTGRQNIPLENILIRINPPKGEENHATFSAELGGLKNLDLPSNGKIYVEPYLNTSSMRFYFGTIGNIVVPEDTSLADVDAGGSVLFRVKVVDETGEVGKILAAANSIRPMGEDDDDNRKSLLPVEYRNLGEAIWMLDLQPGAAPKLVLNNRLPSIGDEIRNNPVFQGAIIPHAVRQILQHIFFNDECDDESEWVKDWKKFCAVVLGQSEEIDDSVDDQDKEDLIVQIMERYTSQTAWVSRHNKKPANMKGAIND